MKSANIEQPSPTLNDAVTVVIISACDDVKRVSFAFGCYISYFLFSSFVPRHRNHGFCGMCNDVSVIVVILTRCCKNRQLTLRRLMSYIYIYGAPILDVSRSHTTTQHSR